MWNVGQHGEHLRHHELPQHDGGDGGGGPGPGGGHGSGHRRHQHEHRRRIRWAIHLVWTLEAAPGSEGSTLAIPIEKSTVYFILGSVK